VPNPLDRLRTALDDRYAIEREVGQGGTATVYLAEDLKHERRVAIKVLRRELAAVLGPERFLREIRLTAQLSHPHILPLLDSGEAAGLLYYIMPLVEGESLRERLQRERRLSIDDAVSLACELADALSYAHGRGLVHRDVKPENVLLTAGHAVLSDFGIARAMDAANSDTLTQTGIVLGTPAYMSPEQVAGEEDLDGRSDIFSLGCVLYETLSGEPPFTGPTTRAVIARRFSAPAPSIRDRRPEAWPDSSVSHGEAEARELAQRYLDAWERADTRALAALLTADARMAMPPDPHLFEGRAAIVDYFKSSIFSVPLDQRIRLAPTAASGQPAFVVMALDTATGVLRRIGLKVLFIRCRQITEIRGYMQADLAARFDDEVSVRR